MRRVALVTDSYPPVRNGVAVAVAQLRDHLEASGYQVAVVAAARRATRRTHDLEFVLASCRLPGIHPYVATGWGFRSCLRSLRHFEPDIVHVHGWGPASLLGIHFARRTKTPLIITWHTDVKAYFKHYRSLLPLLVVWQWVVRTICCDPSHSRRGDLADRFVAALLSVADLVVAPSEKMAKKLRQLPSDTPIVTVPIGVDPIAPSTAESVLLPEIRGPMLLYVGRIAPEKGIDLLLDAYEIVRRHWPGVMLVLAGDHDCGRSVRKRLHNTQDVILTGELDRGHLACLYTRADLFVFPSLTDTQGLVLHEAAHAGLPLVVVDDELRSPVTDERNTTFCTPDPHALAAALMRTLERSRDVLWAAQAARAGKSLAARHSIERQCGELVSLYGQALWGNS